MNVGTGSVKLTLTVDGVTALMQNKRQLSHFVFKRRRTSWIERTKYDRTALKAAAASGRSTSRTKGGKEEEENEEQMRNAQRCKSPPPRPRRIDEVVNYGRRRGPWRPRSQDAPYFRGLSTLRECFSPYCSFAGGFPTSGNRVSYTYSSAIWLVGYPGGSCNNETTVGDATDGRWPSSPGFPMKSSFIYVG